jgi:6,7-dimethyl-8-ribityllumazine synthase
VHTNSNQTIFDASNLPVHQSQVVVFYTEWNTPIISELLAGVQHILQPLAPKVQLSLFAVPGSIELPVAIKKHYQTKHADAYIAIGCVIKGDTYHFEYVCNSTAQGLSSLALEVNTPIINGILTVYNIEQAQQRLGGIHGHKGKEAAITALKMIDLFKKL